MQNTDTAGGRLVVSAKRLFSERGFHHTSMADLAHHAQVSVGTIYRSFASKSEIIRAIIQVDTEDTLRELRADIEKVRNGTVSGHAMIEQLIFHWASKGNDPLNHEIVAEAHRNAEVSQMVSSVCGQLRELLRDLAILLKPSISDTEIEGVAEIMLACLFGMDNRKFIRPRLDESDTAAIVSRIILHGIGVK